MSKARRVVPALAALVYPAVVWAGPALHPAVLLLAPAVTVIAVVAFHRTPPEHPRARGVALLAAGAPALYSWLGGLLDFQHVVPITSLGAWLPLWGLAALVSARETAAALPGAGPAPRLAFAHGVSATVIVAFAAVHIANHLVGFWSGAWHVAVMNALRVVYRQPLIEPLLLACVAFQCASGVRLVARRLSVGGTWPESLQAGSGAYLAAFFASHLTAALRARWLRGVDTNWVWLTSDSLLTDPWSARLGPYYFLAIVAVAVHAAAGLRYVLASSGHPARGDRLFALIASGALVVSALVMAGLVRG